MTETGAHVLLPPLRRRLAAAPVEWTAGVAAEAAVQGRVLGVADLQRTAESLHQHALGLGPLTQFAADPRVTDILVNGGGSIWLDRGAGLHAVGLLSGGEAEVRALAVRLAGQAGRRLDEAVPWVDARLAGGVRLHAVIPPLAPAGTHISLRLLRSGPADLAALQHLGSVLPSWTDLLLALVARRVAHLISGGTGAGKTTLLAALLSEVPAAERIVLVEDVGELMPRHPHLVRLEGRSPNVEGRGGVGLAELVRQALRMRPDRLVVGECRGAEVRELLAALNTGHAGGCGTVHANSPQELPARLAALGALAGLGPTAIYTQAAAAIGAVIHVERQDGTRRIVELAVPHDRGGHEFEIRTAVRRRGERTELGPGWPTLCRLLGVAEDRPW